MQSAEEFAEGTYNISTRGPWVHNPPDWPEAKLRVAQIAALIRARDREIVEACRIALIQCDEMGVDKYLFALDKVLRDLG
jgi:hypothetical protein